MYSVMRPNARKWAYSYTQEADLDTVRASLVVADNVTVSGQMALPDNTTYLGEAMIGMRGATSTAIQINPALLNRQTDYHALDAGALQVAPESLFTLYGSRDGNGGYLPDSDLIFFQDSVGDPLRNCAPSGGGFTPTGSSWHQKSIDTRINGNVFNRSTALYCDSEFAVSSPLPLANSQSFTLSFNLRILGGSRTVFELRDSSNVRCFRLTLDAGGNPIWRFLDSFNNEQSIALTNQGYHFWRMEVNYEAMTSVVRAQSSTNRITEGCSWSFSNPFLRTTASTHYTLSLISNWGSIANITLYRGTPAYGSGPANWLTQQSNSYSNPALDTFADGALHVPRGRRAMLIANADPTKDSFTVNFDLMPEGATDAILPFTFGDDFNGGFWLEQDGTSAKLHLGTSGYVEVPRAPHGVWTRVTLDLVTAVPQLSVYYDGVKQTQLSATELAWSTPNALHFQKRFIIGATDLRDTGPFRIKLLSWHENADVHSTITVGPALSLDLFEQTFAHVPGLLQRTLARACQAQ
jgi:hypothetical protein